MSLISCMSILISLSHASASFPSTCDCTSSMVIILILSLARGTVLTLIETLRISFPEMISTNLLPSSPSESASETKAGLELLILQTCYKPYFFSLRCNAVLSMPSSSAALLLFPLCFSIAFSTSCFSFSPRLSESMASVASVRYRGLKSFSVIRLSSQSMTAFSTAW